MKTIIYEDCNNNAAFLKSLFVQIQELSDNELSWKISNLDFIPVDRGDFINGMVSMEMEKIYIFQKRILEEKTIIISHNDFIDLLRDIKTIYDGKFVVLIGGEPSKIKVLDGDIIEIDGEIEGRLQV